MNIEQAGLFVLAALALLGSPGPAIAALLAIGRQHGWSASLPFFGGLQVGLAALAAASALGLFSAVASVPLAATALTFTAVIYLIYLAYRIATAPVGHGLTSNGAQTLSTFWGGLMLGSTNPKAMLAFFTLFAAYRVAPKNSADLTIKWTLCVCVMIVVDLLWLGLGTVLGRIKLSPRTERALNIVFGAIILATAAMSLLGSTLK